MNERPLIKRVAYPFVSRGLLCSTLWLVGLLGLSLFISIQWVGGAEEPTTEGLLHMIYPGAQITTDSQNRYVVIGGTGAIEKVIEEGIAPKVVTRVHRLKAQLFHKDREDLVVLINAVNEGAPDCCVYEVVLGVLSLLGAKTELLWVKRYDQYVEEGTISLVEAKTDGTQQILLTYYSLGLRGLVDQVAVIYAPRPTGRWYGPMFQEMEDSHEAPFVAIWKGDLQYDESSYGIDMPTTGSSFSKAAHTAKIQFSSQVTNGWRDLIEERTITMLLGKRLSPPLTLRLRYYYLPGYGYLLDQFSYVTQ